MKIDTETRFSHPILSNDTRDYKKGEFSFVITSIEEGRYTDQVRNIDYNLDITENEILNFIRKGQAKVGVYVTCPQTYYSKLIEINIEAKSLTFNPGELKGRVAMRPMIWLTKNITNYSNANLHEEFRSSPLHLLSGDLIAIHDEISFVAGREKLSPMETIFSLAKNEKVEPGKIMIETDSDKITIHCSPGTYESIFYIRDNGNIGKSILLNSIYLPAIMEVLSIMSNNSESERGYRWQRIFRAKCEHLGLNTDNGNILKNAQALLNSPFSKIEKIKEFRK